MVWALVVGLFVGAIAKLIMPGKDPGGFIITMLLGVAGSILANFIGTRTGFYRPGEAAGIFASVAGAVILLVLYRTYAVRHRHSITHR